MTERITAGVYSRFPPKSPACDRGNEITKLIKIQQWDNGITVHLMKMGKSAKWDIVDTAAIKRHKAKTALRVTLGCVGSEFSVCSREEQAWLQTPCASLISYIWSALNATPGRRDAINLRNSLFLYGSLLSLLFLCKSLGTALTRCREEFIIFSSFKNIFCLFSTLYWIDSI